MTSVATSPKALDVSPENLRLEWHNGRVNQLTARQLRIHCQCALCVNEATGEKILDESKIPSEISLVGAEPMGHYAVALKFSDGHATGIYTYEHLYAIGQ